MGFFLFFCACFLCYFCPILIVLFPLLFLLYCIAETWGLGLILLCIGVLVVGSISSSIFDPVITKAKKKAIKEWDNFNAVKLWCDDPEEFYAQLQATQPKMSAETKARVRRIQKQLKEQQKKRVANTMPIARDYPSSHKKR